MSGYGLRKIENKIFRMDSITDLSKVNNWRYYKGLTPVVPKSQSVRQIENAVALGIEGLDITDLPKLVRSAEFYLSIIKEIKVSERPANGS